MSPSYIFEFADRPRAIFSSGAGESTWHVSLKLLAYLLYRRREPQVERGVGQRYKPDLVVVRGGVVRLWIDCGETSLRKLQRVVIGNPIARVVVVKDTRRHLEAYARLAEDAVRDTSRLIYLAFSDGLVDALAHALRQRNRVSYRGGPAGLEVGLNGTVVRGALVHLVSRRS